MPVLVTVTGTLEVGQGMLHIIELPELFLISPPAGNTMLPLVVNSNVVEPELVLIKKLDGDSTLPLGYTMVPSS